MGKESGRDVPATAISDDDPTVGSRVGGLMRKRAGQNQKMATNRAARFQLRPIGTIRSSIKDRSKAPKQGSEGAPDVWLEVRAFAEEALDGLADGDEIVVLTWLHRARRETMKVHPRSDPERRLTGVFATRSPDRPNPIGLHSVTVRKISGRRLRIGPMEAIDGTPVVDIKPVIC
jgi:tRNA-Thr(GGU) m(6)t(6)A37 methyltransferase TsaA